ncbi:MAG: glucose-1-phosphate adenylyltransferase [Hydrogenophaga sp.]|uniref:glucose-1-phosphate adenylyltransferase n=1 Tax=Hydrogenophaga sp. TaxID=1904254 RepID=UPI00271B60EF|nr:glucose-1-phosphate adenylyltransferase [Hydrogenophaga sp.]MDO9148411.1 glucose-1-phosphate adenylyltransferase [Hydrogenophaga sp.]MDO9606396.1 glucose-1-phosphate adenylyltransferase [Hydrogenophaga sp.]
MSQKTTPQYLAKRTIALVLAGGRGSRLQALTDRRSKPAVYFGGKFRIIDFALSNCLNSGVRRISVLTQYKSHSLLRHLQRGWSFLRTDFNEFIDLLPAQQRMNDERWYLGTADAVYQNLDILMAHKPEYILVLAGDHIYKMDYAELIADHVAQGKKCTVGCIEVPIEEASAFGVMSIDAERRIVDFLEKPANPPAMPGKPGVALASMGIYVFDAQHLFEALAKDAATPGSSRDFGKDVIPAMVAAGDAVAHPFGMSCVKSTPEAPAYWRDVGTVDAYWEANLDLTNTIPELDMYDRSWPIWTYQEQLPPAKFVFDDDDRRGMAVDSLVSGGCIISGGLVRRSVLFSRVQIHSYATVEQAVLLPEVSVGRHCRLRKVVVDNGCVIPEGMCIGLDAAEDARRFFRTDSGVVLVTRDMLEALK